MKKLVILVAIAVALALAAVAYAASGRVTGGGCCGALVTIHNYGTGAYGSTYSDGSGNYSFGGLNPAYQYSVTASKCAAHTQYASSWYTFWGNASTLPTLPTYAIHSC